MKARCMIIAMSLVLLLLTSGSSVNSAEKIITFSGSTSGWMSTGICFKSGDRLTIGVSGSVRHSDWDGRYHGPEGNPNSFCGNGCKPYTNSCYVAALVAKIGTGRVRCVGSAISGTVDEEGELMFAINDTPTGDNSGSFEIIIQGGRLCGSSSSGGNKW